MKSSSLSEGNRGNMRSSLFLTAVLSLLLCTASASAGPDYDYGAHPRFICTPVPVDADPACFGGPGIMGGSGAKVGQGHHGTPGAAAGGPSPPGWWGMPEEAKATILHLRESLLKEKEAALEQRETIRELNAKLTLCEGFGRSMAAADDHSGRTHHRLHGPASRSQPGGVGLRSGGHRGSKQPGHRGRGSNLLPDVSRHSAVAGHQLSAGHVGDNNSGARKDKHTVTMTTAGEMTSSPEQMDRMLQALKERLENLQKRNMSSAYSSSLKDLLQRKIMTLEQQLHPPHPVTSALSGPDHHDGGDGHHDDRDDGHGDDHDDHHEDMDHALDHGDPHKDYDDVHGHDGDGNHDDDDHDDGHHGNEDDGYGYVAQTGYRPHSNTLETILNQLHLSGPNRKTAESPDSFQIGFPMRTNYMYSRVKRTLPNEIFALTLCLWIKGDTGTGPGLGTPFSYSVPGQANELVLIEWGNNPMELLVDDKAVTLPLSLSDGKWHHVCVTWSTREGQWEAYQDGVQRGSGDDLSPWHPIKPGGVFIIGQEQDTLGGRFDATQSFVGEISDLQMWSHVLTASDIHSLASCGSHLTGDVITWSETELELHGGVSIYPFDPCH